MKIDFIDNNLIVFFNDKFFSNVNFSNKSHMEKYFMDLFSKLNENYNLGMCGSYNIDVFVDDKCGMVLKIVKDDIDYYDYYNDIVDIKVSISKFNKFLFKLNGDIGKIINKCHVYLFDGDLYLEPYDVNFYELGVILENCELFYGNESYDIKLRSKEISDFIFID